MQISLPYNEFQTYVSKQMDNIFPDGQMLHGPEWRRLLDLTIDRTAYCFKHVKLKAYASNGVPYLNHLHSDQYAVFLWYLSNTVWMETQNNIISNKLFYMNKMLHGFSAMYDTQLPEIFLLLHTVGTVLGRATYGNYFVASQNCTVGAHHNKYPTIGVGVGMLPGSSVIGESSVGDYCSIGINATVYQKDIDQETVVYKDVDGSLRMKKKRTDPWTQQLFFYEK